MAFSGSTVSSNSAYAGYPANNKAFGLGGGIYNDKDGNLTIESQKQRRGQQCQDWQQPLQQPRPCEDQKDSLFGK
jgi:hypothetical protein